MVISLVQALSYSGLLYLGVVVLRNSGGCQSVELAKYSNVQCECMKSPNESSKQEVTFYLLFAGSKYNANDLPTIEDRGICGTILAGAVEVATYEEVAGVERTRSVEARRFVINAYRYFPRCTQDMIPHYLPSLMKFTSTRQPYIDDSSIQEVKAELTRMRHLAMHAFNYAITNVKDRLQNSLVAITKV